MITRSDIANRLTYGVRAGFLSGQEEYVPSYPAVAMETESDGKDEVYADLLAVPMPRVFVDEVTPRGFGEVALTITNTKFELTIKIDHDAINDDRVGDVDTTAREAGQRFPQHKDKLVFQALNGGDGTTYGKCYDGLSFFHASHADGKGSYNTAQSNKGDLGALTNQNFNTAWVNANNFLDSEGEVTPYTYDLLLVSPALNDAASQICDNVEKADTANRAKNPYSGKVRYMVSKYFDTTAWVLIASGEVRKPIILQIRQQPEFTTWDDELIEARYYKWVARYNVGYSNWRLAYMGNS